ncbi:MAG TPA: hypothetical protein PLD27_10420 [bacterium]|nr:hypothetical protein [bacterium]HPQ19342.1 hypothetical protein [bacterium]
MITLKNIPKLSISILKAILGNKIPLKVTQYITFNCNFNCAYCGRKNIKSFELTTDEMKKYIDEFKKIGTMFWSFNGGECLLRNDLGVLRDYVKQKGMNVILTLMEY